MKVHRKPQHYGEDKLTKLFKINQTIRVKDTRDILQIESNRDREKVEKWRDSL